MSPELTEQYIRLPVHNKTKEDTEIVTINVSKDKGIRALYSVRRKKIITLLFSRDKRYNWTMKKAQDWKESHSFAIEATLGNGALDGNAFVSDKYEEIVTFVLDNGFRLKFD